ncbi:hypothetical protein ACSNOB_03200 [Micromonospora sp. URMC 106]|jgi:hypothetical protein|uniref:hypothetical protein n=1 Tax=Micromonospora sp. URMC 106 TaxID=3423408 RepID=UPI003F1C28C2
MPDELAGHGLRPPLLAVDAGDNSRFRSALDNAGSATPSNRYSATNATRPNKALLDAGVTSAEA